MTKIDVTSGEKLRVAITSENRGIYSVSISYNGRQWSTIRVKSTADLRELAETIWEKLTNTCTE